MDCVEYLSARCSISLIGHDSWENLGSQGNVGDNWQCRVGSITIPVGMHRIIGDSIGPIDGQLSLPRSVNNGMMPRRGTAATHIILEATVEGTSRLTYYLRVNQFERFQQCGTDDKTSGS